MQQQLRVFASLITLLSVTGCGILPPSLVEQGTVTVDIEKTKPAYVSYATVYREDNKTVVQGRAQFPPWVRHGVFKGHVDVDIVMPDGNLVTKRNVSLIRERIPKVAGRRARFSTSILVNPMPGTIVRLVYHEGHHRG